MERNRIATWWITWDDLNWPDHDNMDKIKARAEGLAKANVTAAMLFGTHFRWDWLPVFPLLHDYIATVAEELHKNGVKLFDHHSVNLVHRYSTREEMRHVMLDSGPHLPFSPTREAAVGWQYKGKYLNDWRMIDVRTGKPLYLAQYTGEGFCHRNPEFREAYKDYVKYLIAETAIDGLSADDPMYYAHFQACGCAHCREEFKRRSGIDLPSVDDLSFWGNWDNPAWLHWIDLRFEATGDFLSDLRTVVPEDFMLTGCGGSSANAISVLTASDAREFLRGCNYVNLEMAGNTPPYKNDPATINVPIINRMINNSHHQAAARERNLTAFATGFAHSTVSANHVWAVSKILDGDAWIGTLKPRLGLPRHILNTLPEEKDFVGEAFGFEKDHPEIFRGNFVGQLAVYFSYETRNHTMYGALDNGFPKDYSDALAVLFREGICPHTVFTIPKNTDIYPLLLLSGVARMTDEEKDDVQRYLDNGGKVIAVGPSPLEGCKNSWLLPTRLDLPEEEFFSWVEPGGSVIKSPKWMQLPIESSGDPDIWVQPTEGLYYCPKRICENTNNQKLLELCRKFMSPVPIKVLSAAGYLCTMFESEDSLIVHFLAEDYDVDINHELDSIRFHRSRVNLITKAEAIGTDSKLLMEAASVPVVYTPFNAEGASAKLENGVVTVNLPEKCSYAILKFSK